MNDEIWYEWHFTEESFPRNDGSYLCYTEDGYYIICKFSNHLYDIDSNDFCDGGEKGFYRGNSTLGYQRYDAILCWTYLPRSPKIPIKISGDTKETEDEWYYCPHCERFIQKEINNSGHEIKYCPYCGTQLHWRQEK